MVSEKRSIGRTTVTLAIAVPLLLLLAAVAVVGVTAATLPGCTGCHFRTTSFKTATLAAPHGKVSCVACHVDAKTAPRAKFAFYEAFGMRLHLVDPSASDVAAVTDSRCLSCHSKVLRAVTVSGGMRIQHASCAQGRSCVDCHSETGHGSATKWSQVTSMADCVTCHRAMKQSLECKTCHLDKRTTVSFTKPEFAATHGPNWKQTHGMGQMPTCSTCHAEADCSKCHGPGVPHTSTFVNDHPQISKRSDAKCTTCHKQAFCTGCHQLDMPHPKDFAKGHSLLVEQRGRDICLRCHDKSDCDDCHVKHVHPGGAVGNVPKAAKVGQ